ncbi:MULTISPECIES: AraC family transcriptional regulator [Thalassolituus]|jgi:AraC-like DNA-binding protein|uniref:AraC family transcriptional regulator n=1 Tax=Thalassolituus TaxID=187492 RepID=UPI000C6ADA21|nr:MULTISPECIES: AraC family transcriptional regulator [Thalassolituus]MBU2038361.1 AraC family transcriptional regulator [Gammaproteobacteria bacterium]MCB2386625.1 AraC family transcriptional regulator [Thalassolituus alkanivorans]MCB2424197.1 AraC family transcriptional regulator [Thalassolituus alkanivorans]PIQ39230.1 MAG: AraC family transcriptional regulator [Thalassolituus sp. CG17_big_fil_post_rev_8_21_14_2_50_53_8]
MSSHWIPRPFIDAPLRGAAGLGLDPEQLWAAAGLDAAILADPEGQINANDYASLMATLWAHSDDEFMGLAKVRSHSGTFAMMCKAIISCSSLEHALHRARRFYALFDGAPNIRVIRGPQLSRLQIEHDPAADPDHFLSESLLAIWHRLSSWLVGQGIPLLSVGCCYPPPVHAALYQNLFATPVKFNEDSTYLLIPSRVLSLPVSQTAASLRAFLNHSPADFLARPNPHESMTGKLRQLFRRYDIDSLPDLAESAAQLGVSSATLRRRLHDEQTSFQKLKDECRLEEASLRLAQQDTSIREIAEYLGYTETSTFHRAFKKWMGLTPGDYRSQQQGIRR